MTQSGHGSSLAGLGAATQFAADPSLSQALDYLDSFATDQIPAFAALENYRLMSPARE
jgi:hypothetical protein